MKKVFLAILAVGAVATAQAQKPGSILIYGDAGYNAYKSTDDDGLPGTADKVSRERSWNFSPGIGYQFNNNWTAGINFGIGRTTETYDNGMISTEDRMREIAAGLFVRHTMPLNKTFFIFGQVNATYLNGKSTWDDGIAGTPDIENTYNGFRVNWFPAVGVNFTKCMALNFSFGGLGYEKKNWDMAGPQKINESNFNFTFGRQFNIGISANLGGKHYKGRTEPGMDHRHMDTSDDSEETNAPKRKSSDVDE